MSRHSFLAASALTAALAFLAPVPADAEISVRIGVGAARGHAHRGPHGHYAPRRHHAPRGHHRPHRFERHHRGHARDLHRGHRGGPRHLSPRLYGMPRPYFPGSGCRLITERYFDRFGRPVLVNRTICHDRFGYPFRPGGPRWRH